MRTKTKAKTRSLKLPTSAAELKWYTFEEVFAEAAKKKGFLEEYHKARERLALARQVRTTRTAKRLTQAMVAKKASMPQSAIARLESGDHGVSLDTLSRVAHALGKKVALV